GFAWNPPRNKRLRGSRVLSAPTGLRRPLTPRRRSPPRREPPATMVRDAALASPCLRLDSRAPRAPRALPLPRRSRLRRHALASPHVGHACCSRQTHLASAFCRGVALSFAFLSRPPLSRAAGFASPRPSRAAFDAAPPLAPPAPSSRAHKPP